MNNPLHINNNNFFKYAGEVDSDNDLKAFNTLTNGYRAGFYVLKYYRRIGYNTIESIINNMITKDDYKELYIKFISDNLKINKNDIIMNNLIHINIIFQLSYLLNNEYEKDIDAIINAFSRVYDYTPSKELLHENNVLFEKFIPIDIIFEQKAKLIENEIDVKIDKNEKKSKKKSKR